MIRQQKFIGEIKGNRPFHYLIYRPKRIGASPKGLLLPYPNSLPAQETWHGSPQICTCSTMGADLRRPFGVTWPLYVVREHKTYWYFSGPILAPLLLWVLGKLRVGLWIIQSHINWVSLQLVWKACNCSTSQPNQFLATMKKVHFLPTQHTRLCP